MSNNLPAASQAAMPLTSQVNLNPSLTRAVFEAKVDWANRTVQLRHALKPHEWTGLEEAIAAYERQLTPATAAERAVAFGELVVVLPPPPLQDSTLRDIRWQAYHKALNKLPFSVVRAACCRAATTCRFFPKPAELLELSREPLSELLVPYNKLRALKTCKIEILGVSEMPKSDAHIRAYRAALLRKMSKSFGSELAKNADVRP